MTAPQPAADRAGVAHAGTVRLAGAHAFRVLGDLDVVNAAETAFGTMSPTTVSGRAVHDYVVHTTAAGHVVTGQTPSGQPEPLADCLETVQWLLNRAVLAGLTAQQTGIHAACAQGGDQLLLMPAASGSGKSTLVAGLARAGWSYVTDEASVLDDETLTVRSYPKPITLDHGAWPYFPETAGLLRSESACLVPVTTLGAATGSGGPVTAVVSPAFRPGSRSQLEPLTPAELVMTLAGCTFQFSDAGARHLPVLARLARSVPGYRLHTGDVDEAVDLVEQTFGARP